MRPFFSVLKVRHKTAEIIESKSIKDVKLNKKICESKKWKSPLCNNYELQDKLRNISKKIWVDFGLMIGITMIESHIGVSFNRQTCSKYNNRSWIKYLPWYKRQTLPTKDWCWLWKYKSVEEFRESFAKILKVWYIDRGYTTPENISKKWVWTNWLVKWNWSKVVRLFYMQH